MAAKLDRFDSYVPVVETANEADTTVSQDYHALYRALTYFGLQVVAGIVAAWFVLRPVPIYTPFQSAVSDWDRTRLLWLEDRLWLIPMVIIAIVLRLIAIFVRHDERFRTDIICLGRSVGQLIGRTLSPLRWTARLVRANAVASCLAVCGVAVITAAAAFGINKAHAAGECAEALFIEQRAFSSSRTDWMACAVASQGVSMRGGSLRLAEQSPTSGKWATSTITGGNWTHVGGSPDGDVWLTNETGVAKAAHYVSGSWTEHPIPSVSNALAVSGVSTTDAWAVGVGGMIAHWNGSSWSTVTSPATVDLKAVTAISAGDAYAVGGSGVVIRYDGSRWRGVVGGRALRGVSLNCVVGDGLGGVYVGGTDKAACPVVMRIMADLTCKRLGAISNYNGCVFSLSATAGSVIAAGFVTGAAFTVQWNGSSWTDLKVPAAAPSLTSVRMAAASDTNVWVTQAYAGDATYFRWNGRGWVKVVRPSGLGVPNDIQYVGKDFWVATSTDKVDKFTTTEVATPKYQSAGVLELCLLHPKWRRGVVAVADLPIGTDIRVEYSDEGKVWAENPSDQTGPLHVRFSPSTSNPLVTPTLHSIKPAN